MDILREPGRPCRRNLLPADGDLLPFRVHLDGIREHFIIAGIQRLHIHAQRFTGIQHLFFKIPLREIRPVVKGIICFPQGRQGILLRGDVSLQIIHGPGQIRQISVLGVRGCFLPILVRGGTRAFHGLGQRAQDRVKLFIIHGKTPPCLSLCSVSPEGADRTIFLQHSIAEAALKNKPDMLV